MARMTAGIAFIAITSGVVGQPPAGPAFDVASIKPNKSGSGNSSHYDRNGTLTATNVTLDYCIQVAYRVKEYQIQGPSWLSTERYDIVAKTESPVPPEQYKLMIQALLADRFKMKVHRETKDLPVYALVIGKRGSKLREVEAGGERARDGRGYVSAQKISMARLADRLSWILDRPVLDRTGMRGVYDVELKWIPDEQPRDGAPADAPSSIFTAVQEQLGLKLEPQRGPIEMIVVDHADKIPTEN